MRCAENRLATPNKKKTAADKSDGCVCDERLLPLTREMHTKTQQVAKRFVISCMDMDVCVQYGEGCGVAQIGWYNILVYARRFRFV